MIHNTNILQVYHNLRNDTPFMSPESIEDILNTPILIPQFLSLINFLLPYFLSTFYCDSLSLIDNLVLFIKFIS